MSDCFKLIADNRAPNSTVSARPTVNTELKVENIKNYDRSLVARWDLTGTVEITIDLPALAHIQAIILIGSNLSTTGTIDVGVRDGAGYTGNVTHSELGIVRDNYKAPLDIDYGIDDYGAYADDGADVIKILLDGRVQARSLKISIRDTTNPDGYQQLRHIVVGSVTEFERGYAYGSELTGQYGGEVGRLASGHGARLRNEQNAKTASFSWELMTNEDRAAMARLRRNYGNQAWYVMGAPWLPGSIGDSYEFLGVREQSKGFSRVIGGHATDETLIEV